MARKKRFSKMMTFMINEKLYNDIYKTCNDLDIEMSSYIRDLLRKATFKHLNERD